MPTIKEAIARNQKLIAEGKNLVSLPTEPEAQTGPIPPAQVTGLPVRGVYTPNQIMGPDFLANTTGMRIGPNLRSATFPPQNDGTSNSILVLATKQTSLEAKAAADAAQSGVSDLTSNLTSVVTVDPQSGVLVNRDLTHPTKPPQIAAINPTVLNQIIAKGSVYSSISASFSYTSDTSSITWSWTGVVLYRADGSSQSIPDGSQAFTGLVSATTYYFYPAWNENAGQIVWIDGAQTAVSIPSAAAQINQGVIPMSLQVVSAATTSSGTGGGSGGGAGGGGGRGFV